MMNVQKTLTLAINVVGNAQAGLNSVRLNIDSATKAMSNFNKATQLAAFNERLNKVGMSMNSVGRITDVGTGRFVKMEQAVAAVSRTMGGLNKRASTFDMRLLSLLFGGMALQRAFGGVLRGLFNTFSKAEDNTSGLSQATTRLSASWEFMKFSIMDALNTEFFIGMIDGLINFIDWLSQLDSKWKVTFLAVSTGLFLLGGTMMLIGQFKLGWDAILGVGGFLNAKGGLGKSTDAVYSKTLGKNGVMTAIGDWAKAGVSFYLLYKGIQDWKEGDLLGVFQNLGTGVILWTAGVGYAIPFYLMFEGFKFAKQISDFGKETTTKGFEQSAKGLLGFIKDPVAAMSQVQLGAGKSFLGFATTGLGEFLSGMEGQLEGAEEKIKNVDTALNTNLIPTTETVAEKVAGKDNENSADKAFKKMGDEMANVSGEKTTNYKTASQAIRDETDDNIEKINEATAAWNRMWAAQRGESEDYIADTEASSVTGE